MISHHKTPTPIPVLPCNTLIYQCSLKSGSILLSIIAYTNCRRWGFNYSGMSIGPGGYLLGDCSDGRLRIQ
jgi:hypothetical protein